MLLSWKLCKRLRILARDFPAQQLLSLQSAPAPSPGSASPTPKQPDHSAGSSQDIKIALRQLDIAPGISGSEIPRIKKGLPTLYSDVFAPTSTLPPMKGELMKIKLHDHATPFSLSTPCSIPLYVFGGQSGSRPAFGAGHN